MSRRRFLPLTVICVSSLALLACGEKGNTDPRSSTPLVRTFLVQDATSSSLRSFTGVISARVQSNLGFRVSGKVLTRFVDAGQIVKSGQLLMRIDPVDLGLAAQARQEAVVAAQARARQTAQDEARYRDLLGTGAVSASTYDQFKVAADTAKAQLNAAEAEANVARNATQYAELKADADGVVMETLAEPGQVVSAGQTVIRLAQAGRREAVVQLPETLRPAVGSVAQATLFGRDGGVVTAVLRQLSDTADPMTRTFEARYVLQGDLASAPLGATVTIHIPEAHTEQSSNGMKVPIGALYDSGKGPGVWVIKGQPTKVTWQPVSIQHLSDDSALISSSLKNGDKVVSLGAQLLHEGEQVLVAGQTNTVGIQGALP